MNAALKGDLFPAAVKSDEGGEGPLEKNWAVFESCAKVTSTTIADLAGPRPHTQGVTLIGRLKLCDILTAFPYLPYLLGTPLPCQLRKVEG